MYELEDWYPPIKGNDKQKVDFEQCNLMFVYGTLKKGYGNHRLLESSEFLGPRTTKDVGFMAKRGCPFVYLEGTFDRLWKEDMSSIWEGISYNIDSLLPIAGELYRVDWPTFLDLDSLECEGYMYHRNLITTSDNETCWIYEGGSLYLTPAPIKEGKWNYVR